MRDPEGTAIAFAAACDEAGVPYAIIEGLAVSAWGQPRATHDVDVLAELDATNAAKLAAALARQGLALDERDVDDALAERSHVTIFDDESGFHVDVKLARTDDERREVRAAIGIRMDTGLLRVAAPEDVLVHKLVYGTPQDVQDARSILLRQGARLDLRRLEELARRWKVHEALDRLRSDTS